MKFEQGKLYLAGGDKPFGVPFALVRAAAGAAGFVDVEVFDVEEAPLVPGDAPMEGVDTVVRARAGESFERAVPEGVSWVYALEGQRAVRLYPPIAATTPASPATPRIPPPPTPRPGIGPVAPVEPAPSERDRPLELGWTTLAAVVGVGLAGALVVTAISRRSS